MLARVRSTVDDRRLVRISTVLGCCHQHAPRFLRRSRHLRRTYQAACSYLCLSGMLAQRPQGMVRITVVTPRKVKPFCMCIRRAFLALLVTCHFRAITTCS